MPSEVQQTPDSLHTAGEWGTPGGPIPKNAQLTYHIKLLEIIEDPDKIVKK